MALNQSMEVYLSLITVLIMCIPGLAFLVQRCRNRQAKQTQMSELLPISEQPTWTVVYFDDTIFRVPTAPHHPCRVREEPHYASQRLATPSKPHVDFIELVGDQPHRTITSGTADTFILHWQDSTTISLPQSAHVRPEHPATTLRQAANV